MWITTKIKYVDPIYHVANRFGSYEICFWLTEFKDYYNFLNKSIYNFYKITTCNKSYFICG